MFPCAAGQADEQHEAIIHISANTKKEHTKTESNRHTDTHTHTLFAHTHTGADPLCTHTHTTSANITKDNIHFVTYFFLY